MESELPERLIAEHKDEQKRRSNAAKDAVEWFLADDRVGEMLPRREAIRALAEHMDSSLEAAAVAISDTVGDIVDPVQQMIVPSGRYVGVLGYEVYSDAGAYGYIDYDDRKRDRKRVVCARCVEKHDYDEQITHATQGEGTCPDDATWEQLLARITSHYTNEHTQGPDEIEPGASLLSGTTISGNQTWHAGNDGLGSGLSADVVEGEVNLVDANSRLVVPTGTDRF